MPFESGRPFGFRSGFEPGEEYASPFGTSRPEMLGLGDIGEAARQASQFPVIAGGGAGAAIPGLSQVEVTGGPSQIGDEDPESTESAAARVAREQTPGGAGGGLDPATLAGLSASTALKGGRFARDISNLSFFSPAGGDFQGSGLDGLNATQLSDFLMGGTVAPAEPGGPTIIGGGGGGSLLGTIGSAAGAVGSALGLAGGVTDNTALRQAGSALEVAGTGLNAFTGASDPYSAVAAGVLAAVGPYVKSDADNARLMATISQATTLASMMINQSGVGAAVAAAINSAMEIYKGLSDPDQSGGETTVKALLAGLPLIGTAGGDIGDLLYDRPWDHFGSRIGDTAEKATGSLGILEGALPFAQTKEELGQVVNAYQNHLRTTTDWGGEGFAGTEPYRLGSLPQAGGSKHEGGQSYDFGPQVNAYQSMIDALLTRLPGEAITEGYGTPAGSFASPEDTMRLWTQHTRRQDTAPTYIPASNPTQVFSPGGEAGSYSWEQPGAPAGFHTPGAVANLSAPNALPYGVEGYDYAGSGFPEPGQFAGSPSTAWLELLLGQAFAPQARPSDTPGRAMVAV